MEVHGNSLLSVFSFSQRLNRGPAVLGQTFLRFIIIPRPDRAKFNTKERLTPCIKNHSVMLVESFCVKIKRTRTNPI